jgi:hypothetical protein
VAESVERAHEQATSVVFLGAGDIGDRSDVVPVNAVAQTQPEAGSEKYNADFSRQIKLRRVESQNVLNDCDLRRSR